MMLELALDRWDGPLFRSRSAKETLRRGADQVCRKPRVIVETMDAFDIGNGRPAAVVSHPVEAQAFLHAFHFIDAATHVILQILSSGKILERNAECQHLRSVI